MPLRLRQEIQTLPRDARLIMVQPLQARVTRGAALKSLRALLAEAGIEDAAADARLLLCAAGADGWPPRGGGAGVAHSVAARVLGPAVDDIARRSRSARRYGDARRSGRKGICSAPTGAVAHS